jgi:peptidoglycan/LPS O-acetylase OafA/YrhL
MSERKHFATLDGFRGVADTPKTLRFDWIDAIRGIAILMVILIHVGSHDPQQSVRNFADYGSRGVQLFFIVSAFTLFRAASVKFNPKSFYIRRYARIAPMYFLAVAFYATLRYFDLVKYGLNDGGLATYVLLVPFMDGLSPYTYGALVPGGWSISCEFLFYYSLPFLVFLCRGFRSTLVVLCLAFVAAAVWVRMYAAHIEPYLIGSAASLDSEGFAADFNNFAFFYQIPVFVSGMLLVYVNADAIHHFCAPSKIWTNALHVWPYLAVAVLLAVAASGNATMQSRTVTVFILFLLVLGFKLSPENLIVNKIMVLVGKYSYSIYLVHWIFLDLYANLTARFLPEHAHILQFIVAYGLVTTSAYMIAALTYRFVEAPFIQLGHRLSYAKDEPARNARTHQQ